MKFYVCIFALACGPAIFADDPAPASGDSIASAPAESVERPTFRIRAEVYLKKLIGGQAFLETVPGAISDHARNFPSQWGRGFGAFGMRTANQYGQFLVSSSIEAGVQAVHKEDPRYFLSHQKGTWRRTRYAVAHSFLARKPDGGTTVAWSMPAGVYGSWLVATRWCPPDLQTPFSVFEWGTVGMGMKVAANIGREFWPDVKRKLFHKP